MFNGLFKVLAERVLGRVFAGQNWKSETGLWSLVLGIALYYGQKNGITPAPIDGDLGWFLDWLQTITLNVGSVLLPFGLGDKVGSTRA